MIFSQTKYIHFLFDPAVEHTMLSPPGITLDIQTLTPISTIYKYPFIKKAFMALSFLAGGFMITDFIVGSQTKTVVDNL